MKRIPFYLVQALLAAFSAAAVLRPEFAHAYVGPGAGLTAIGTVIALLAAVALALVGFVWYPLKRMFRRAPVAQPQANEDRSPRE